MEFLRAPDQDSNRELIFGTKNSAMQKALDELKRAAERDVTSLIRGETGTGKDIYAREMHAWSPRRDQPFVRINCGTIADDLRQSEISGHAVGAFTGAVAEKIGLAESAQHGMLFLDEIGDASPSLQKQFLDLVQLRSFRRVGSVTVTKLDLGIVAATNRNLNEMILLGHFRGDLYWRFMTVEVFLPPLRARPEDIPVMAQGFLERSSARLDRSIHPLESEVIRLLLDYAWPGNVRQLENLIHRLVMNAAEDKICVSMVAEYLSRFPGAPTSPSLPPNAEKEKQRIEEALGRHHGVKEQAARDLGMDRGTLRRRIRRLGIEP
jgi:two-component system response regulator HydG